MLSIMVQTIAGCGGGGGGSSTAPSTKTATLKLSTQSINSGDLISGFDLKLTLPVVSALPIDASGNPLPGMVHLSGKFAGAVSIPSQGISYNSALRELTVIYSSADSYSLGEFITVLMVVPVSYVPNMSDINITLFTAGAPITGNPMPTVTAKIESFN